MENVRKTLPTLGVRSSSEQVADQLRALVLQGYLKPGDKLPSQDELCSYFGVGRSTIREGIQMLSADGLLHLAQGSKGGTTIRLPLASEVTERLTHTLWLLSGPDGQVSIEDLFEMRLLLEVNAASAAARHRTESALDDLRIALANGSSFETNRAFHRAVVAAAPNAALRMLAEPIFVAVQMRSTTVAEKFSKYHDEIEHDHAELFEAIQAKREKSAAAIMKSHLLKLLPIYQDLLGTRA